MRTFFPLAALCVAFSAGAQQISVGTGSPATNAPGGIQAAQEAPKHNIEISGYAILNGSWMQSDDANVLVVGKNDGFAMGDARIELTGRPTDNIWVYLSIDGASPIVGTDPTQGIRVVQLKDAYGVYAPSGHLRFQAGQFKAPQDLEELLEEPELKFVSRSIVSIGVAPPIGYAAAGLGLDRQLGVAIGTDRIETSKGGIVAQLAITNGNGANQLYNDTQYPSVTARYAMDFFGRALSLGLDGYFQPRAYGTQPTVFRDNLFGVGFDLLLQTGAFHAMLIAELRDTHHLGTGAPDELSAGISGEVAYKLWGFVEPKLRVSFLDSSDQVPGVAVVYYTGGLNFYVPDAPARLMVEFTHRTEQASRDLANDSVDASVQVRF
jgi:Phosphate-selective porin O and P